MKKLIKLILATIKAIAGASTPDIPDISDIRSTQLFCLIQLGYAKAAGFSKEAFARLVPVPENRAGALLVVPSAMVSIAKQMKLVGITNYLKLNSLEDLVSTPKTLYWIYNVENGKKMLDKSPDACVRDFAKQNRRGLTVVEGINLVAQNPNVPKGRYIDLPGSRYDPPDSRYNNGNFVPSLGLNFDRLELHGLLSSNADSESGSASCLR